MSTTQTQRLQIKDGPKAHLIWTAAQFAYDPSVEVKIEFTLDEVEGVMWELIYPQITGADHEDGSGQSLLIRGYLDNRRFEGWYDARKRVGYLNVDR